MRAIIYRRNLSYTSGAGQLIAMQARALRAAGIDTTLACQRSPWAYWLRSGLRARRLSAGEVQQLHGTPELIVVDHGMELPGAQVVFSHNLMSEARRYLQRPEIEIEAQREQRFFAELNPDAIVVANSELVCDAIARHFGLPEERLRVCYPGFRAEAFASARRAQLRAASRRALGVHDSTPLVGFVTSGDLQKRGMGIFMDTAAAMLKAQPHLRFLVVGSVGLPNWMRRHALLANGTLLHRGRGGKPAKWMAALDVFLYPARFEEFGMVVLEACALGVPVITSRRVGASELLPEVFSPWVTEAPDAQRFADLSLQLLADEAARSRLAEAGIAAAARYDDAHYAARSLAIITGGTEAAA